MNKEKAQQELAQISAGLSSVEDPYGIKDLLPLSIEELAEGFRREYLYSGISMLNAGRYCMAIKEKLPFGKWEEFVAQQRWNWEFVRSSMRLLELYPEFPSVIQLPPGRSLHQLLHLSRPQARGILTEITPEVIETLTSWDLLKICKQKRAEKRKPGKPPKPLPPEMIERIAQDQRAREREREEAEWAALQDRWSQAFTALGELVQYANTHEIRAEWFDRIFRYEMVAQLGRLFDEVVRVLHPVEEVLRHEEQLPHETITPRRRR
jgi:hypothetical protein